MKKTNKNNNKQNIKKDINKSKKQEIVEVNEKQNIFKKIFGFFPKLGNRIKKIFSFFPKLWNKDKKNKIILLVGVLLLIIVVLLIAFRKKLPRFALNEFYDVYPEEVRALYSNLVEVSCEGDLHLDIKIDEKATSVEKLSKETLLDYVFSNIDKNEGLSDEISKNVINARVKNLFSSNVDLDSAIKNYQHGEYVYNLEGNMVKREKKECASDIKYVTFLYGYSWNKSVLSMDVNISYQKGDTLYDLNDKELGKYDGDVSKLFNLTKEVSYYRFNYIKSGSYYKLDSVEWLNRS